MKPPRVGYLTDNELVKAYNQTLDLADTLPALRGALFETSMAASHFQVPWGTAWIRLREVRKWT